MSDRVVRVNPVFFDFLDDQLGPQRSSSRPTSTDFLVQDLPNVLEHLARDFENCTVPVQNSREVRAYINAGVLVRGLAIYVVENPDGSLDLVDVELDLFDPLEEFGS
jgi:hypothetical protein